MSLPHLTLSMLPSGATGGAQGPGLGGAEDWSGYGHGSAQPALALYLEFSGGSPCDLENHQRGTTVELSCGSRYGERLWCQPSIASVLLCYTSLQLSLSFPRLVWWMM